MLDNSIVLFGHDGCGKSTVLRALSTHGFNTTSIFDLFSMEPYLSLYKEGQHSIYARLENMIPENRVKEFSKAMYDWINKIIIPLNLKGPLIVDSYVYRYSSKERIFNPRCVCYLNELDRNIPVPKYCLHLKSPLYLSFERNTNIHRSDIWPKSESVFKGYSRMQTFIEQSVFEILNQKNCSIFEINARRETDDVLSEVLQTIKYCLPEI